MKLCLKKRKDHSLRQQGMVSWTVLEMSRSLIRSHVLPGPWACVGVGLYRQLGTNVDLWGWAYGSVVECLPDCSWLTQGSPFIPSTWNQCCWIWTLSPIFHMTDLWNFVCADFYLTLQWGIFHHTYCVNSPIHRSQNPFWPQQHCRQHKTKKGLKRWLSSYRGPMSCSKYLHGKLSAVCNSSFRDSATLFWPL